MAARRLERGVRSSNPYRFGDLAPGLAMCGNVVVSPSMTRKPPTTVRRDPFSPEERRQLMRRVRVRDTAPELKLRKALWAAGARGWRVDCRTIPGRPDLAWIGLRLAVFVDGAFWHGHPDYYRGQSGPFWDQKIARNRARDAEVNAALAASGWTVVRFWDFEVYRQLEACVDRVLQRVSSLRELRESNTCSPP